jgi:hypothetical protein
MAETRDVVERLRGSAAYLRGLLSTKAPYVFTDMQVGSLMERQEAAAAEIEALRAEVERLRSSLAMRDKVLHRPRRRPPTP